MRRAECWEVLGDLDRAVADLTTLLGFEPDRAGPYYQRGRLHLARGDHPAAKSVAAAALDRDPTHAGAAAGFAEARRGLRSVQS